MRTGNCKKSIVKRNTIKNTEEIQGQNGNLNSGISARKIVLPLSGRSFFDAKN